MSERVSLHAVDTSNDGEIGVYTHPSAMPPNSLQAEGYEGPWAELYLDDGFEASGIPRPSVYLTPAMIGELIRVLTSVKAELERE